MKFVLFSISLFVGSLSAQAASLDDLLKMQSIEKIEPVTVGGVSVDGKYGTAVCGALGFTRLVSAETEPCLVRQEDLVYVTTVGAVIEFQDKTLKCGDSSSKKLKSVTCAR